MNSRYFKILLLSLMILSGFTLPAYANAAENQSGIAAVSTTTLASTDLVNPSTVNFVVTMIRFANYLNADLTPEQKTQINNMKTVVGITYQSDIVNIFSNAIDLQEATQNKTTLMANKAAIIKILVNLTTSITSVNEVDSFIPNLLAQLPQLKEMGVDDPIDLVNFAAAVFKNLSSSDYSGVDASRQLNIAIDKVPIASSLTKYGISGTELKNAIAGTMGFLNEHGGPEFKSAKDLLKIKFIAFMNQNSTTTSIFRTVDTNDNNSIHIDEVVQFLNKPDTNQDVNGDGIFDKKDVSLLLELVGPISIK